MLRCAEYGQSDQGSDALGRRAGEAWGEKWGRRARDGSSSRFGRFKAAKAGPFAGFPPRWGAFLGHFLLDDRL